jgi:hypothetical protein
MSDHIFAVQPNGLQNGGSTRHVRSSERTERTEQATENGCRKTPDTVGSDIDGLYEPIAIIGLATKFPGDAVDTESFWETLLEKRSALTKVPEDRYNVDAFVSANRKIKLFREGLLIHTCRIVLVKVISSGKTLAHLMQLSSPFRRLKPRAWIHSNAGCWKLRIKPLKMVSTPPQIYTHIPGREVWRIPIVPGTGLS